MVTAVQDHFKEYGRNHQLYDSKWSWDSSLELHPSVQISQNGKDCKVVGELTSYKYKTVLGDQVNIFLKHLFTHI
jgi:hypothetical protein